MLQIIVGVGFSLFAAKNALGILFPKLRGRWRNNPFPFGRISCIGVVLAFGSIGLVELSGGKFEAINVGIILLGFIFIGLGNYFDNRSYLERVKITNLSAERRGRAVDIGWVLGGSLIFIAWLLFYLFRL